MNPSITIARFLYDEPYVLHFGIEASNGRFVGYLEFFAHAELLIEFADILEVFPRHSRDAHLWELGSERSEDKYAYFLRLRLFTTDSAGHSTIQIRFNNNRDLPDRELSEFCIPVEPAALKRLGRLLREFAKLENEVLFWDLAEGRLFKTQAEFDTR